MKNYAIFFVLCTSLLLTFGCKAETEKIIEKTIEVERPLTQQDKEKIFEDTLAGKNANTLLAKLSTTQKTELLDLMLTDEKKSEIIASSMSDSQKAEIFNQLLTAEKKNEIFSELLTSTKKTEIFDALASEKHNDNSFINLLTAEEKDAVYNNQLTTEKKAAIFNDLLTDEKKSEIFTLMLTEEKKASIFDEIVAAKHNDNSFVDLLASEEKESLFDTLLSQKKSVDFIKGILNESGNEDLRSGIKSYFVSELSQSDLQSLLDATDTDAPNDVTNFAAENLNGSVRLTWTDSTSDDVLAYEITYKTENESRAISFEESSIIVNKGIQQAVINNLENAKTYIFTIKVLDQVGNKSIGKQVEFKCVHEHTSAILPMEDGTGIIYCYGCGGKNLKTVDSLENIGAFKIIQDSELSTYGITSTSIPAKIADATYYTFGVFPQTIKADNVIVNETIINKEITGAKYYLGNDGSWYGKVESVNRYEFDTQYKYSNGNLITSEKTEYFKVEPIVWRKLNSTGCLLAEKALMSNVPFYGSSSYRELNGDTIYPYNYMYSNIRAYLNGINNQFVTDGGSATEYEIDWTDKGFINQAFTLNHQKKIKTTIVKNDVASIKDAAGKINTNTYYGVVCPNTNDKIFLLSTYEATLTGNGFDLYNSGGSGNTRIRKPTDFALANKCELSNNSDYGCIYRLRSPILGQVRDDNYNWHTVYDSALNSDPSGNLITTRSKTDVTYGKSVVPALFVKE